MATDEFSADPVARIMTRLVNPDRNIALSQRDAKCQACEAAADDGDWDRAAHDSGDVMTRYEKMAEESGTVFRVLPLIVVRP